MMTSNVVDRCGTNDLKTLCVDADFFENGKENLRYFSKISGYVWTGKNNLKTLYADSHFFENRRKKAPFSKISRYMWTSPLFTSHEKLEAELLRDVLPSWSIF